MNIVNEMKPGDIILEDYKGKYKWSKPFLKLQDIADDGIYNHVAMYIGNGICIEQNFQGLSWRNIDTFNKENIKIKELIDKPEDFETKLEAAIAEYIQESPLKYGYFDLFKQALSVLAWRITRYKAKSLPDKDSDFCSELIKEFYYRIGIELTETKPSPNDLDRSNKLRDK